MEMFIHLGGFAAFNVLAALLIWQALKAITTSSAFRESDALSSAHYPTRASGLLLGVYALACTLFVGALRDDPYTGVFYLGVSLLCFYAVTFIASSVAALKKPTLQSMYCAVHSAVLGAFIFLFVTVVLGSGSPV